MAYSLSPQQMDTLRLTATGVAGEWPVVAMTGEEALSELFEFRLTILLREPPAGAASVERGLLGDRATLQLGDGAQSVVRSGVVAEARVLDTLVKNGAAQLLVLLKVVPTAWLLTQRRKSRIFQKLYLWEIVSQVFTEAGVRHRWALANKYPRRIYCTQYDETDWEFVKRLLAEEGVFFYFEHPEGFVPTPAGAPGEDDRFGSTLGPLIGAVGKLANVVGENFMGEGMAAGATAVGGGAVSAVGEMLTPSELDEEAPMPREGGSASRGPSGAGDVLVFADQASHYLDLLSAVGAEQGGVMTLRNEAEMTAADTHVLLRFAPSGAVRPEAVESRDYDFRRPLVLLRATHKDDEPAVKAEGARSALEVYEHHGEYETPDINAENARNNLEQLRTRATLFLAEGNSPRLQAGHLFLLQNRTEREVEETRYVPIRVVHHFLSRQPDGVDLNDPAEATARAVALAIHQATRPNRQADEVWDDQELRELIRRVVQQVSPTQPQPYRCVFECVEATVTARPPRPPRTPRHVVETATVVGPRGEEIYTDKYGRVKVQFHWDRENQWDAKSSCWVRVSQPWAGAGYGFQFVPRVGMEVLVSFVRGDPDRPIIVGALYNGTHETPEPLPVRQTRSAIRTQSSPGGGGFNELSFEDQRGLERVTLKSEKDLEIVANDHHFRVAHGGETVSVGQSQRVVVAKDQFAGVGEHQSTRVGGSQAIGVRGSRADHVHHDVDATVDGGVIERVGASATRAVRGDASEGVSGSRVTTIKGDDFTHVGVHEKDPRIQFTRVLGESITVARSVRFIAEPAPEGKPREITLEVGRSRVHITDECIELRAPKVVLRGTDEVLCHGGNAVHSLKGDCYVGNAPSITLDTQRGACLSLEDAKAALYGKRIRLEPDRTEGARDQTEAQPPEPNVTLQFSHGFFDGAVVAHYDNTKDPRGLEKFLKVIQDNAGKSSEELMKAIKGLGLDPADEPIMRHRKPERLANVRVKVTGKVICEAAATDGQGLLKVHVPEDVDAFTVQLFVHEAYPKTYRAEDEPMTLLIKMEPEMPPVDTLPGVRYRLRNLGYEPGPELAAAALDPATESAIEAFKQDRVLVKNGLIDDVTLRELQDLPG